MFEPLNIKATYVAINYNFTNPLEFAEKLESKNILNKYGLKLQEAKFAGQGPVPPPQVISDLRMFVPFIYISEDTSIEVIYSQNEFKLYINKQDLNHDNYSDYYSLAHDILDFKLSDISAIGINYSAEFNLGKTKLNLINSDAVNAIKDFNRNKTFEFVLPIEYKERDLLATYRIKKLSGGDEAHDNRVYEVKVNYHFDLSKMSTADKAKKVEEILSVEIYDEFLEKCQQFLSVNNEE